MLTAPIKINRFGLTYYLGLENLHYLTQSQNKIISEPHFRRLPTDRKLKIWDIGANIGLFTLFAASYGHEVTAFELSKRAAQILKKNLAVNNLYAFVVAFPLTVKPVFYKTPRTAHQENKVKFGPNTSITWKTAVINYGIPDIIKMDIEGGEEDFLCNEEFSKWIKDFDITLFVESHTKGYTYMNLANDQLYPNHLIREGKAIRNSS